MFFNNIICFNDIFLLCTWKYLCRIIHILCMKIIRNSYTIYPFYAGNKAGLWYEFLKIGILFYYIKNTLSVCVFYMPKLSRSLTTRATDISKRQKFLILIHCNLSSFQSNQRSLSSINIILEKNSYFSNLFVTMIPFVKNLKRLTWFVGQYYSSEDNQTMNQQYIN